MIFILYSLLIIISQVKFTGEKIKISLAFTGATKHNGLSAFGGSIHRTESDSCFRGYE